MQYDVELKNIKKQFNKQDVVKGFNLQVKKGEFISFLGPSGCGKTTTLNMLAGFLDPSEGELFIKGKRMNNIPPYKRELGMVFQTYSLFPHMTVFENVAYGLKLRKKPKAEIESRVRKVLELVQLPHLHDRFPNQLSGGQRQRIAIARALVTEPSILLLDEPLSNLDAKLRVELRDELKRLHKQLGVTTIFVTHDQEEALSLSDRIVVMSHGNIEQIGTPNEIYNQPKSEFVHTFIGQTNQFEGNIKSINGSQIQILSKDGVVFNTVVSDSRFQVGESVNLFIRPESIFLGKEHNNSLDTACIQGKIKLVTFLGSITEYHVAIGDHDLVVRTQQPQKEWIEGADVLCCWNIENQLLIRREM
ncbi:ABC transporter ATP-binding protein [Domibacillus sp. PGB-M46]|uniref:ABC transporter ATP-binding protein n=1 Tax=Domibacillus sp. PGB-M46 TaxID=2910255 RepID=UPI001F5A781D|nr:ABC transporter ATP-binding protein [Domibacillus sp. PGB-M46]MCI2256446.1 ABC transporter ATP-binding protein [Domibacillus sp. PGB-M46]